MDAGPVLAKAWEVGGLRLVAILAAVLFWAGVAGAQTSAGIALCRGNAAYSADVMRNVLAAQLEKDHDAALDAEPPEQMAAEASAQGVKDCATDMQNNPPLYEALAGLSGADIQVGWDAYNTACSDRTSSKAACVKAEVGAVRALKRMVATNQPPGARTLVETCELVLKSEPAMADWRECVDTALAVHAPAGDAARCKTAVPWHTSKTGAESGRVVSDCLTRK
jgi:hypothetical protein